jgi:hypothetical protein
MGPLIRASSTQSWQRTYAESGEFGGSVSASETGRPLDRESDYYRVRPVTTSRGKGNSGMLAMLHGCTLRRGHLLSSNPNSIQLRQERWGNAHLIKIIASDDLIKIIASDEWTAAALKLASRWPWTTEVQSSWWLC